MRNVIVYDLKGSQTNRFAQPHEGRTFTGLDTNFKIDRNGEPLNISAELHERVLKTLQRDCNFLS